MPRCYSLNRKKSTAENPHWHYESHSRLKYTSGKAQHGLIAIKPAKLISRTPGGSPALVQTGHFLFAFPSTDHRQDLVVASSGSDIGPGIVVFFQFSDNDVC